MIQESLLSPLIQIGVWRLLLFGVSSRPDDEEEFVLSGTAGTQTVTLVITDENMQVGNVSVAKLELTMGGQTIVIGEVTRSKVDYKLKIYDKEGNDITEDGVLK